MKHIHENFQSGIWLTEVDVRDFIQCNYKPYAGEADFLAKPTARTKKVLKRFENLLLEEHEKGGVLDIDTKTPSTITSHKPGFIDQKNDIILGLQTEKPLQRAIKPKGGVKLVKKACESYGYKLDTNTEEIFTKYRKTHNDGVFDVYLNWDGFKTPDGKKLRTKGVITGLPDNYGRGRIIGDYRRVALYGTDRLIADKKKYINKHHNQMNTEDIHTREEVMEQIRALTDMKIMAESYGFDISRPAENFQEAVQWTYFAYLAAVKEQDGAAMSFGRIDAFLDIYAELDLKRKKLTEEQVQEIIDDFVLKLRAVRHLRPPEYNALFAGDPTWVTCLLGGQGVDGRTLVTKSSYRLLHTLENLGSSPEPNLTVAWTPSLPDNFAKYSAQVAINTCSIQFESDELMRERFGDDYAIACCVSCMKVGEQMQFFGARCNMAKLLLMALNEGRSEIDGSPIAENVPALKHKDVLDYDEVNGIYRQLMRWMAEKYVKTMNVIHFMHDKYSYEGAQMALHKTDVERFMAFGIAGFSVVADSLSAIKYAKVRPIRNEQGIAVDFEIDGDFPKFGNDDDQVDQIAIDLAKDFTAALEEHKTYRNAKHTLSLLTITANVVYGAHTGATPDGRKSGEPFAPGANPMHNRDTNGAICSLNSVAKIPYDYCLDGISNTFSIVPDSLGKNEQQRVDNLKALLDGYFTKGGFHLNVNVLHREVLKDAMKHPEKYPQLTIRVSGYAVHFINLTKEQQEEVISRTFHERI